MMTQRRFSSGRRLSPALLALANAIFLAGHAAAQSATNHVEKLPTVQVTAESEADATVQPTFLPPVDGTRIFSGKKASVVDFDSLPQIQSDNYRQALSKTPGLLVSELSNPGLLSLGTRGIGDPHETQDLLVLRDGIPFVVDLLGYPTVYYAPPLTSVDRLEFIRGGASLLYGPQPGGALNYVTHMPRRDKKFSIDTQHTMGSDNLYSSYTRMDGTDGRLGYLAYFDHRQGDSFRDLNSDFLLNGGSIKLVLDADRETRWIAGFDAFDADSGEPGGLTHATVGPPGSTVLNYDANRDANQNPFDRIRVKRFAPSLTLQHDFDEDTTSEVKLWGGYYSRKSKRQTDTGFGTVNAVPVADADGNRDNLINHHQYYTFAADARIRHEWAAWAEEHVLTAGFTTYYSDSPFTVHRGETPNAETGVLRQQSQRGTVYGALFAENKFTFDRLSVVPGFRLENIHQNIEEQVNLGTGEAITPKAVLSQDSYVEVVPLFALGLAYDVGRGSEAYANVAQGYKAKTYTDAVPLGTGDTVSANLEAANSWTYEIGLRGVPRSWLTYDVSFFWIDYDNRFGRVGPNIQNVGRSINKGIDIAVETDLIGLYDDLKGNNIDRDLSLNLHGNVEFLDAQFESGPLAGLQPQYAPSHVLRTGAVLRSKRWGKLGLLGTFADAHYADDAHTANRFIPSYMVWDLTAEVRVYRDNVRIIGGINNLLDEDYYSRIRSNGIDPAYGRNGYIGIALAF